jgi:hypothetical protein
MLIDTNIAEAVGRDLFEELLTLARDRISDAIIKHGDSGFAGSCNALTQFMPSAIASLAASRAYRPGISKAEFDKSIAELGRIILGPFDDHLQRDIDVIWENIADAFVKAKAAHAKQKETIQ